jgi:hypothetical protein
MVILSLPMTDMFAQTCKQAWASYNSTQTALQNCISAADNINYTTDQQHAAINNCLSTYDTTLNNNCSALNTACGSKTCNS